MKPVHSHTCRTGLSLFLFGLLLLMDTVIAQPTIRYTLGMPNPSTHLFEVELAVDGLSGDDPLIVQLPVWRPGRYQVMDFAGGVQDVTAETGGTALRWSKTEKSVWRIETGKATSVTVRYKVYANEFSLRTRGLNDEHAFVDGSAVFMYAERFRKLPVTLNVRPYKNWHVTTGLEGSGTQFTAADYDEFVDCPIEVGTQKDLAFEVDGVPHILSIAGQGNWNADTLTRDIAKIVKAQKTFWGSFPYTRYVFLLHLSPNGGGGTEHLNSTIIGARPYMFKNPDAYRGFLGLVSHEFFHTWNVKQLRPKGMHPYDYMKENYVQELWIAEGTTSYYDELLLVRAGFTTPEKYLDGIAGTAQGDRQRPGNLQQPIAEASFDAWVKYWRGTEQAFNFESDYYGKGAAVSLLLDLEIRQRSSNAASLDDVMRTMLARFPLSGPGYTLSDFQRVCEEFARASLEAFFRNYITGTAPLPWEASLASAGLRLAPKDSTVKPWIGLQTADAGEKTRVVRVVAGSPAAAAGLDLGDEIVAMNGRRARSSDIVDRLGECAPGEKAAFTLFRDDRLREFTVTVGTAPVPSYRLTKDPQASELQKTIYQGWLQAAWAPPDTSKR